MARAYAAAWVSGDPRRVVAFFTEDAVVRYPRAQVFPASQGALQPSEYYLDTTVVDVFGARKIVPWDFVTVPRHEVVVWASGPGEIRDWVAELLTLGYRAITSDVRGGDGAVRWEFKVVIGPFASDAAMPPLQGTAEAVLRGASITSLTLVVPSASVAAREAAARSLVRTAVARRAVRATASLAPVHLAPPHGAVQEKPVYDWALVLIGGALVSGMLAARRRSGRTRATGARCGP